MLRMLTATLRRHASNRTLHNLQKRLLDPLTRHITGDGGIVRLAGNLVDLVYVDDTALRALHVIVRGLQQLEDNVLYILANVTRFREGRGVGHGKRHVQDAGQGLS